MMARATTTDPTQQSVQKVLLYVLPLSFAVFGYSFPIGVLLYWLTTNVWSMGQQAYVIKRMPPPVLDGAPTPSTRAWASKDAKVDLRQAAGAGRSGRAVAEPATRRGRHRRPAQAPRPGPPGRHGGAAAARWPDPGRPGAPPGSRKNKSGAADGVTEHARPDLSGASRRPAARSATARHTGARTSWPTAPGPDPHR